MPSTPTKKDAETRDTGGDEAPVATTLEEAIVVGYLGQVVDTADYTFAAQAPAAAKANQA